MGLFATAAFGVAQRGSGVASQGKHRCWSGQPGWLRPGDMVQSFFFGEFLEV